MKIEIIDSGKKPVEWARFSVSGIDASFANMIRKAIISQAPVLAIEDVTITENSSSLYDEVIALRLGLIPIKTDDSFELGGEGATFSLKAKGPKWVYSSELVSSEKKIAPAMGEIPIVYLDSGQAIELEAKAVVGVGADHMKWQAGFCIVQGYPKVAKTKGAEIEYAKGVSAKDALVTKDGEVKDLKKWTLGLARAQVLSGAEITEEEDRFIFYVESFGQLPLADLIDRACKATGAKLGDLAEKLK